MDVNPPGPAARRPPVRPALSSAATIGLAIGFGLCAGYLDVAIIVFKRFCWNPEGYYRTARDFPWTVPAAHAAMMVIPGMLVAAAGRLRPRLASPRVGSWLLATLAIWAALLRLPLYGAGSLLLAAGLGRPIAGGALAIATASRRAWWASLAVVGVLGGLAIASSGREAFMEYRQVRGLPQTPPRARNVVLIVWDTVRSLSLGIHGHSRPTTPMMLEWARKGVRFPHALAPAPWTFPSHSCFFTGEWPMKLDTQRKLKLDARYPTLPEYLASRGYQTAGFVANTSCCTYETGLSRGFAHYEDYSMSPLSILARTVPGDWIVSNALRLAGRYQAAKWARLQSRDAREINETFLDWLGRRRADRPFFAFLNYFDAHEPYLPPEEFVGLFGIRPRAPRDYEFLLDYAAADKQKAPVRDILMARDCYESCIAYLDDQLGRLLGELESRGLLADTDVIVTSDHGEAFGEHGFIGHCYTVALTEVAVPLLIISPGAPAGRVVLHPVSLRDLPATVVDRLGLSAGSPFPGRSLAAYWEAPPGQTPPDASSPAFSEQFNKTEIQFQPGPWGMMPGFQMSVVTPRYHYVRDGGGNELLYDLNVDHYERNNLLNSAERKREVEPLRRMLLKVLTENAGAAEVERDYLGAFRRSLELTIGKGPAGGLAADPVAADDAGGSARRKAS
jgi:arylsulfatase A-like enzyme